MGFVRKVSIIVRERFEAFHMWPVAPDDVAFLRNSHRHLFYVEVEIDGGTGDRTFEFFQAQRKLREVLVSLGWNGQHVGSLSCEAMAEIIGTELRDRKMLPVLSCAVFEDGENGARVSW